jgi:hypothetical protein
MNAASATVMAMSQGLTRGFHCTCAASGFATVTEAGLASPGAGIVVVLAANSLLRDLFAALLSGREGGFGSYRCEMFATRPAWLKNVCLI